MDGLATQCGMVRQAGDAWQNLVGYVDSEGLLSNFAGYDLRNLSSFSVAPSGSLTSNQMSLINSPTLGTGGVTFDETSSQYARISDFIGSEEIWIFHRAEIPSPTGVVLSKWDISGDKRSFVLTESYNTTNSVGVFRSGNGGGDLNETGFYETAASSFPTTDSVFVVNWKESNSRNLWINNSLQSLSLISGRTAQSTTYDSESDVLINATENAGTPTGLQNQTVIATCFIIGASLTSTQRETITTLINEL